VPEGSDAVVIPKAGAVIVSDNALVALPPPLSDSLTVKLAVPGAEGVPPMTPVDARLKPCGNTPCDIVHVTGETAPDAARAAEYGEPVVPFGNAGVVITGLELTVIRRGCVSVSPLRSCTLTVNWETPLPPGVPLMVPTLVAASVASVSPAGSVPADTDQV